MKSNYIPEILKEKLSSIYNFIYFLSLLLVSIISGIALLTFSRNFKDDKTNICGTILSYELLKLYRV